MKFRFRLKPAVVIIISVIIGIVMITSAYFELNQSKGEIFNLLSEQSSSLIETVSLSSINTLNSSYEIEDLITERLFNNAHLIRTLDSLDLLTHGKLVKIGNLNDLYRINVFNKNGDRILSNRIPEPGHYHGEDGINRYSELKPILTGKEKEIVIGLKNAEFNDGQRYAIAVARANNKGAIVINLDAKDLLEFRKKIGIGKIIKDIADNHGIEYIVLQDTLGILAASSGIDSMSSIHSDVFLQKALKSDSIFKRISVFKKHEVYEVAKRLEINNNVIGLYRIGLSLDEVRRVEARMSRRAILISIILAAISIIVLSIVFTQQNLKTVSDEFTKFKTFTGSILEDMGEAVIVINDNLEITLFNKASTRLFHKKSYEVLGKRIDEILNGKLSFVLREIDKLKDHNTVYFENEIQINEENFVLLTNITKNINENNELENYTIVIQDLTETRRLEEQSKRQEKLSAMGELASGVAHEIRNPINSIGMIAQRLNKEFSPKEDETEYDNITKVLKDEVNRINKIITQFLNYAKPLDMELKIIDSKKFFDDIYLLFIDQAKQKNINLLKSNSLSFQIKTDPELVKQSLMNIIQNSIDAVKENGTVKIDYQKDDKNLIIEISDNGIGIDEEKKKKIFELYFTTKNDGNGLGLSIAQKIISQLGGTIEFDSKLNKGTTFTIILPAI